MGHLAWVLAILSALSFLMAVIGSLSGWWLLGVGPEGYSRACTNLALLAVVLLLVEHKGHKLE